MTNLTTELALQTAEDDDDTADYLTLSLSAALTTLDGEFNASTGHNHNGAHQGSTLGANAFADNSIPGAKLVDGSVTTPKIADGAVTAPKLASGLLESLFAGATVTTATNYTVAAGVMFVFVTANATITLPAAASTNRPITIEPNFNITATVAAVSGGIYGGSFHPVTGAVQNGTIISGATAMEAVTYKSDGPNWRAV